jgi:hypothetical protein
VYEISGYYSPAEVARRPFSLRLSSESPHHDRKLGLILEAVKPGVVPTPLIAWAHVRDEVLAVFDERVVIPVEPAFSSATDS